MPLTNFPGGLSSFGLPVLPGSPTVSTGKVLFVDSNTGSNNNRGTEPTKPLATVDKAFELCAANKGDRVYVMPGHAETVTATSIAHDVAGVSIIGLGEGDERPTFTYGAAAATITVSAANGRWQNCRFVANFDNVAAAFTIGAAKRFKLIGCDFIDTSAILHFLSIVVTGSTNNAADGLTITDNFWHGLAVAPAAFISVLGNLSFLKVLRNFADMASTDDEGSFLTLSSKVLLGAEIGWNKHVVVGSTGAAVGIFLTGSATTCTGIVHNNYVASLDTTAELIATAGTGLKFIENYYTGTADASGKLWPAADAA